MADPSVIAVRDAAPLAGVRHGPSVTQRAVRLLRAQPIGAVALLVSLLLLFLAVFADAVSPYDPLIQDYSAILQPPSAEHLLGTDNLGRDLLSRVIYGARISLVVGISSVLISVVFGTAIGLASGFFRGKLDLVVQRVMDAWIAFPLIIFALAILAALGPGIWQTVIAVGVVGIPTTNRIVRGAVVAEQQNVYVEAATAIGATRTRIMLVHIIPNIVAPILVIASLTLARSILTEASLSFLGLGVQPPEPSWGGMLSGPSRVYMLAAPWMAVWPGVAISLSVLSWNLLGDALRDVLDPRLQTG